MSRWGEKEDAASREGHPAPPWRAPRAGRPWFEVAIGVAVVLLLLPAPVASAAPPANDNFADAVDLGAGFPVATETWSTVDATEETGEPYDVFTVGHSVWFRWEATTAEVVTIDTCESEFQTSLYVFTGSDLNALTETGRDSNVDGRFCLDADGVTFRPSPGTVYWIFVDGHGFHLPESPAPKTQGSFRLKVQKTPDPINDDFAQATPIETSVSVEIGEEFSYSAWADGFNWNATKEAGEPDHVGDPGGASVWYRWTAPRSGHTEIGACGGFDTLVALYAGSTVDALSPVALDSRPAPCFVNFTAIAGTTYRIAVDGKLNTGTGFPKMGGAGVNVALRVAPKPSAGNVSVQTPDTTPPKTTLSRRVLKRTPPVWIFSFGSNEPGSTFECKLDKRPFKKCRSSKTFKRLRPGRHTLKVRAVDLSGNVDKSPAVAHFTAPGKAPAKR